MIVKRCKCGRNLHMVCALEAIGHPTVEFLCLCGNSVRADTPRQALAGWMEFGREKSHDVGTRKELAKQALEKYAARLR